MSYKNIFLDGIMHMGDMIMTASVLPVIRKNCPDARITYLCSANLAFVAKRLKGIDQVIPYSYQSKGGYMDVYHLGRKLAKQHFDLGISLDPRERVTLMKWFARIPERLSMEKALGWNLGWEKYFYTQDLELPEGWKYQEHSMASSFQQMMRKFFHDPDTDFIPPRLKSSNQEDSAWANKLLQGTKRKKVALCIQTTSQAKDWPAEKFSQICDWLIDTYDARLYLTGVSSHKDKGKKILLGMKHTEKITDLIGNTTFGQLIALLEKMDLLLSLDTGTAHIGAASGCPVVTIFTHNSPIIYKASGLHCETVSANLPCSGKHVCIGPTRCPETKCVDGVSVTMVQEKVRLVLG